ncbi:lipase 3-like [Achroia grisella]|uniref:lipase 3-like n=1 Tax=Achroia grisella TaxID=688607 RepID=UPI0027D2BA08|nr:lipase 3-like [Achroia grisella]
MLKPLLFMVLATAVVARRSPNADYVENWLKENGNHGFTPEVIEDALLDAPGLIEKYGYPVEIHKLTTPDNYVLEVHRIPYGRDQNNEPDPNKPVVLVMHGLISSSAEFVVQGPEIALGYALAEAGYDVWLGNARGNFYSRENLYLDPNDRRNPEFWRFSWDEIGNIDLPVTIDHILEVTGHSKLHYIGHSQGCTIFFVLNSLRPEYNEKFISVHAMAPAAFFLYSNDFFTRLVAPYSTAIEVLSETVGYNDVFGNRALLTWFGINFCKEGDLIHSICVSMLIAEGDIEYFNTTLTPVVYGHSPAGSSVRQAFHYLQGTYTREFRRYNHIPIVNIERYGQAVPPSYDLSLVTAPINVHYSLGDATADYRDIYHLVERLPNVVGMHQIERTAFSHRDFVWGIDAKEQVYDKVINLMREAEAKLK